MNKTETKPLYVPGGEDHLWEWFNQNQSQTSFTGVSNIHKLSEEDMKKLKQLWRTGQKDSFNQAYYSMYKGSPTRW